MVKIAVIGGAGSMGQVFTQYFKNKKFQVLINDINKEKGKKVASMLGVEFEESFKKAVENADIVFLSLPIPETPKILNKIFNETTLKTGKIKTIVEITSLKEKVFQALEKIGKRNVQVISLHPLFGPGVKEINQEKIVLVPVKDKEKELDKAKEIFNECKFITLDLRKHEELMGLTISLNYFLSLVLAFMLENRNLKEIEGVSGPTFKVLLLWMKAILSQNPSLILTLQTENKNLTEYIEEIENKINLVKKLVFNQGKAIKEINKVKNKMSNEELKKSYRNMYKALNIIS